MEQEEVAIVEQWCSKHISAATKTQNNRQTVGSTALCVVCAKAI
jgi:hypothetical protein